MAELNLHAQAACQTHFGQGHRQPAFSAVVARLHQPGLHGLVQLAEGVQRTAFGLWHVVVLRLNRPTNQPKMTAAQLRSRLADDKEKIAGPFQIHRHRLGYVGHNAEGRDEQRAGDGVFLAVAAGVFVVQAVFAADEGGLIGDGRVKTALGTAHQTAQPVGQQRITPAEIVQNSHLIGVRAHGRYIPQRLIHSRKGHVVRVEVGISRADAVGQSRAFECGVRSAECGI